MSLAEHERISGEREIVCGDKTVTVFALPGRKILRFANAFDVIQSAIGSGSIVGMTSAITVAAAKDLVSALDESVVVHHNADTKLLDLPFLYYPQIIKAFFDLNFDLDQWRALGQMFGVSNAISDMFGSLTSEAMSQLAGNFSSAEDNNETQS